MDGVLNPPVVENISLLGFLAHSKTVIHWPDVTGVISPPENIPHNYVVQVRDIGENVVPKIYIWNKRNGFVVKASCGECNCLETLQNLAVNKHNKHVMEHGAVIDELVKNKYPTQFATDPSGEFVYKYKSAVYYKKHNSPFYHCAVYYTNSLAFYVYLYYVHNFLAFTHLYHKYKDSLLSLP